MSIWQSGDLVITLAGPVGTYNDAKLAAWSTSGEYRGAVSLQPPILPRITRGGIPPVQLAPKLDGTLIYGFTITESSNTDYYGYMDGTENHLISDRIANLARGQVFDAAGNRYISDWDPITRYHIRKIAPDGTETIIPYDALHPEIRSPDPNRLQVNSAGTIAYWTDAATTPYSESINVGCNRLNLLTGEVLGFIDLRVIYSELAVRLADFAVDRNDNIWFLYEPRVDNILEHITITDANGVVIRDFPVSEFDAGMLAVNDAGTLAAVTRDTDDWVYTDIFDNSGNFLIRIDHLRDSASGTQWGMCFTPEQVVAQFFPFVTLIGAT